MLLNVKRILYLLHPDRAVMIMGWSEVLHKHRGDIFAKEVKSQLQEVPPTGMHLTLHLQQGEREPLSTPLAGGKRNDNKLKAESYSQEFDRESF